MSLSLCLPITIQLTTSLRWKLQPDKVIAVRLLKLVTPMAPHLAEDSIWEKKKINKEDTDKKKKDNRTYSNRQVNKATQTCKWLLLLRYCRASLWKACMDFNGNGWPWTALFGTWCLPAMCLMAASLISDFAALSYIHKDLRTIAFPIGAEASAKQTLSTFTPNRQFSRTQFGLSREPWIIRNPSFS